MIGQEFSHYRILRKLGEGGMGQVYLAIDTSLDRMVALKFLPVYLEENEFAKRRFLREAKAAGALDHPFLCHIHEVGESEGRSFIVMEYIEGQTLKQKLSEGPLPVAEALRIITDISEALMLAHERGIIHRDLKPGNIMLTAGGHAKVMDFGLAKVDFDRTKTDITPLQDDDFSTPGAMIGTVSYMSPEQIRGEDPDSRTDLFALGITLYEMVTGTSPFQGTTSGVVISEILNSEPRKPRSLATEIPAELETVILQLLRKDKQERIQTADELLKKIRPVIAAEALPEFRGRLRKSQSLIRALSATLLFLSILTVGYITWSWFGPPAAPEVERVMLAVLPLQNLSADPEQEYFSDGLTEEMIATLGSLRPERLGVIARTSVMRFKNSPKPVRQVAKELGVEYVLEGSVHRSENRVRINSRLIKVRDESTLWTESYERETNDLFRLQTDIAERIATSLAMELLPEGQTDAPEAKYFRSEAFESYLKGRFHWNKRTDEGLRRALGYFEEAITIDPEFAPAYAGLADTYAILASYLIIPEEEVFPAAKEAALKSVALDDTLAEAHTSLAGVLQDEWQWEKAEREYLRAIELNSSYALAHMWYAELLSMHALHDQALIEIERARQLDPLSLIINLSRSLFLIRAGQCEEADRSLRETLELDSDFYATYLNLGGSYLCRGLPQEAITVLEKALTLSNSSPGVLADLGRAHALAGNHKETERIIGVLKTITEERFQSSAWLLASVYVSQGENDEAFRWLETSFERRERRLPLLKVEPCFAPIRNDPRYEDLIRRLNLD